MRVDLSPRHIRFDSSQMREHRTPNPLPDARAGRHGLARRSRHAAFTLIELVIVMGMLILVLAASYEMIVDCIDTDRTVDKVTLPEKVGDGLMAIVRQDLSGTYFRQFGRRIFTVVDGGTVPDAMDELAFLTTEKPTPSEVGDDERAAEVYEMDVIIGVRYYLRQNPDISDVTAYSLYRKEMIEMDPNFPLESTGIAYELYDKLAFFSVECFDGLTWDVVWDSESRIEIEEEELALMSAANEGISRVTTGASATTVSQAPGVAPEVDPTSLPPSAVPAAVRVEFGFYTGRGNQIDIDRDRQPVLKTFSATIPLISARRLKIEFDDLDMLEEESAESAGGRGRAGTPGGGAAGTPGGGRGGGGAGGRGGGAGASRLGGGRTMGSR